MVGFWLVGWFGEFFWLFFWLVWGLWLFGFLFDCFEDSGWLVVLGIVFVWFRYCVCLRFSTSTCK